MIIEKLIVGIILEVAIIWVILDKQSARSGQKEKVE